MNNKYITYAMLLAMASTIEADITVGMYEEAAMKAREIQDVLIVEIEKLKSKLNKGGEN